MSPMQTVLTRMLSLARSFDRPLVIAMPAAREMDVGMEDGPGVRPPRLVTLMILPPPTLRISGMTARMKRTAPQTFKLKSDSQSSSLTASKGLAIETPALFTRMSMRPKLSSVVCTTRVMVAGSATSPWTGSTVPFVAFWISSAAAFSTSGRRATMTTRAPSSAMRWAAAFPMPSLPPVMIATLSFSPRSIPLPPWMYADIGGRLYQYSSHGGSRAACDRWHDQRDRTRSDAPDLLGTDTTYPLE